MEKVTVEEACRRILKGAVRDGLADQGMLHFEYDIDALSAGELTATANVLAELLRTGQLGRPRVDPQAYEVVKQFIDTVTHPECWRIMTREGIVDTAEQRIAIIEAFRKFSADSTV